MLYLFPSLSDSLLFTVASYPVSISIIPLLSVLWFFHFLVSSSQYPDFILFHEESFRQSAHMHAHIHTN